jgi:hypothetical protein
MLAYLSLLSRDFLFFAIMFAEMIPQKLAEHLHFLTICIALHFLLKQYGGFGLLVNGTHTGYNRKFFVAPADKDAKMNKKQKIHI